MAGHKYSCSHFVFQYEGHFSSNFSFSQSLPWANSQLQSSISKMSNIMKRNRNHKRERWLQLPPRAPPFSDFVDPSPSQKGRLLLPLLWLPWPPNITGVLFVKEHFWKATQQNLASEQQKKLKYVSTFLSLFSAALVSITSFKSRGLSIHRSKGMSLLCIIDGNIWI